jgi:glycogen(starch) synthase
VMGPPPSKSQRADAASVAGLDLYESPCALEWMDNPWSDVDAASARLLELERELRPDVIHLNGYSHAAIPWRAPILVVGHSCVLSWWRAVHGDDAPARTGEYAARVAAGLRAADLVVAPTNAMLAMLRHHYGFSAPSRVISNGREGGDAAARLAHKEPMVLTAGRLWDQAKNISAVVAAAAHVEWPVYVAGEPRSPAGLNPCLDGVHCLGRLPPRELEAWMNRAAIYALPARYEPFGLSVLEAALAECALVLGDIESLRETWDGAAWFVRPDDSQALTGAIRTLAGDRERREDLARRAHARARLLTPERMADAYHHAYADLVSGRMPVSV